MYTFIRLSSRKEQIQVKSPACRKTLGAYFRRLIQPMESSPFDLKIQLPSRFCDKCCEKVLISPITLLGTTCHCQNFEVRLVGTKDENSEVGATATGACFPGCVPGWAFYLPGRVGQSLLAWRPAR